MSIPDDKMRLAARKPGLPARKPEQAEVNRGNASMKSGSQGLPSRKPGGAAAQPLPARRPGGGAAERAGGLPSRKPGDKLPAQVRRERAARRGFAAPVSGKTLLATRIVSAHKEFAARMAVEGQVVWEEYVFQGDWDGWVSLPKRLKEYSLSLIMDGADVNMVFPGVSVVDTARGLSLSVSGVVLSSGEYVPGEPVSSGHGEVRVSAGSHGSAEAKAEAEEEVGEVNRVPVSVDSDVYQGSSGGRLVGTSQPRDRSNDGDEVFWETEDEPLVGDSDSGSGESYEVIDDSWVDASSEDEGGSVVSSLPPRPRLPLRSPRDVPAVEETWEQMEYGEEEESFDEVSEEGSTESVGGKGSRSRKHDNSLKNLEDAGFASVSEVDWDDAKEEANEEKRQAVLSYVSDAQIRLMDRDIDIIEFLTRYKFALDTQVARRVGTSRKASWIRLSKLEKAKLVRRVDITRGQTVWLATQRGVDLVLPGWKATRAENVSLVTMAHELGLANIGLELEIGGEDVLKEGEGWPFVNRENYHGEMVVGEHVVTTREIRVGEARWDKDASRDEKKAYAENALSSYSGNGFTAETLPGNEGFFVMYSDEYRDHVPDMVVARERDAETGEPNSVAIELELSPKTVGEWERILLNYKSSSLFKKVVYFTHKQGIALGLKRVNDERVGLTEDEFTILRYEPKKKNSPFWG